MNIADEVARLEGFSTIALAIANSRRLQRIIAANERQKEPSHISALLTEKFTELVALLAFEVGAYTEMMAMSPAGSSPAGGPSTGTEGQPEPTPVSSVPIIDIAGTVRPATVPLELLAKLVLAFGVAGRRVCVGTTCPACGDAQWTLVVSERHVGSTCGCNTVTAVQAARKLAAQHSDGAAAAVDELLSRLANGEFVPAEKLS